MGKFLDLNGVSVLWTKIKATFVAKDEVVKLGTITDANAITETGIYDYPENTLNLPSSITAMGSIIHINNNGIKYQITCDRVNSSLWFRGTVSGIWKDWQKLANHTLASNTVDGLMSKENHALIGLLKHASNYPATKQSGVHYGNPTVYEDEKTVLVEWLSVDKEVGSNGYEEGVASFTLESATEDKAGLMSADDRQAFNTLSKGYEYYIHITCSTDNWRDVLNGIETLRDFGSRLSINGKKFNDSGFEPLFSEFIDRIRLVGWNNTMRYYSFLNSIVIDVYSTDGEHFIFRYSGMDGDDWIYFTTSRNHVSGKMSGFALLYDGDPDDLSIFSAY